jgi:hypothetical protein
MMPLIRYFVVSGITLLGLLFLADRYLPANATATAHNDVDRSITRIRSSQRWPDAIQMDTRIPATAEAVPVSTPAEPGIQAYAYAPLPLQKTSETIRRPATRRSSKGAAAHHVATFSHGTRGTGEPR